MAAPCFRHAHRVTYAECTVGNHVYYGRYLDLLEVGRSEFFRHLGVTFQQWQERGLMFPVIECRMRYRAPARYDDVLSIEVWPAQIERVRLAFGSRILDQSGALIVEGETLHVCAGLDERPRRLPEDLAAMLRPWLRAGSEAA